MPMSEGIVFELQFFSRAFFWGILMMVFYSVLAGFRKLVKHSTFAVAVEDLLYWLLCSVCIFRMLYMENSGAVRGFAIVAVVLGMILYLQFEKLFKKIRNKLKNLVKRFILNLK